ncbi:MAG: flagellar hook assembly protein FlgD [Pseudobdellovibrio sp.]
MSTIDTKAGTKTWREPGQGETDLKAQVQDRHLTKAQKDMLGADDIGSVLNKISDPNYVDPSKKVSGAGNNKMDKDAFFKLMLAQLKNQDPTNPLKNHEMAAQLAQFSSLEQMTNMNKTLTEIKGGSKPVEQFQALNLIGKEVSGDSAKITRSEIDKDHEVKFNLPQDSKTAEIKILNNKNEVVRSYEFSNLKQGENKITWNGENERGQSAKAGDYKVEIEAVGNSGQKLSIKTDFTGVVTGMSFSPEGPILQVGKQSIRLKDIRQFSDPSLKRNDQNSQDITALDLKKGNQLKQTNYKEETKSPERLRAEAGSSDDMFSELGVEPTLVEKIKSEESKANAPQSDKEMNRG